MYSFGGYCIPSANREVDLLLRYRFTAKIKAILVSYLFPASFFQFWKQIKVAEWDGARSGLYGGSNNNCHLKELLSCTSDEAV